MKKETIQIDEDILAASGKEKADLLIKFAQKHHLYSPQNMIDICNQVIELCEEIQYPSGVASAMFMMGKCFVVLADFNSAIKYSEHALQKFRQINDYHSSLREMEAMHTIGRCYRKMAKYDKAIEVLIQCENISRLKARERVLAGTLSELAIIYGDKGDFEFALKYHEECMFLMEKIGQKREVAVSLINIGVVYTKLGEYAKSIEKFQEALDLQEKLGMKAESSLLISISGVYVQIEKYEEALRYADKGLNRCREIGNRLDEAGALVNIGQINSNMRNYKTSYKCYTASILISRKIGAKNLEAQAISGLSWVLYEQKMYVGATRKIKIALRLLEEIDAKEYLAIGYHLLGLCYASPKNKCYNFDNAVEYLKRAILIAESIHARETIADIHFSFCNIYKEIKNFELALVHQEAFHKEKTTLLDERANKQIVSFQIASQVEQVKKDKELQRIKIEQLTELDRLKSRFFANISHEFRTPLALILAPLNDLIKAQTDENIQEKYSLIHRNAQRLTVLINQLLDLSRLDAGKLSLQVRPENVSAFLRAVSASFMTLSTQKEIQFLLQVDSESEKDIWIDHDKLEKIAVNLLSNAFKFTPEKGKVVLTLHRTISEENLYKEGISLTVEDNGIGITPEDLPRIFDRFYQVTATNSRAGEGSGIGLSLTKELVELYRGKIKVESQLGEGTKFTVWLPANKEDFKPEEYAGDNAVSEKKQQPPFPEIASLKVVEKTDKRKKIRPKTETTENDAPVILVVEDNEDMRRYLCEHLRQTYRVVEAADGAKALQNAVNLIPDLVLSDVMMPEVNGYDLCAQLKQNELTSHIPVILLSAKSSIESKLEGLEVGADEYLYKPFDAQELRVRVKNLLEQRKRIQEYFRREVMGKNSQVNEVSLSKFAPAENVFLERIAQAVEKKLSDENYSVEQLAYDICLSRSQLHRKLVALTGQPPIEFIRSLRLKKAAELLHQGMTVSEVVYKIGFNHVGYFSKCFRQQFGVSPAKYNG